MQQWFFYGIAALLLGSGLIVILVRNTVLSVLFLVLAFIASAMLWLMLNAEFLALVLVLVYVGAVMTLFLFVVMMLNLNIEPQSKRSFLKYLPLGVIIIAIFVAALLKAMSGDQFQLEQLAPVVDSSVSNTHMLGSVLYTVYVYPFELAAVILLVAIVAAIALAFRGRQQRKNQNINEQVNTQAANRVRLVKMAAEKRPGESSPPADQ